MPVSGCATPEFPPGDLWVFGYDSLMWRPGFAYEQILPARLYGYRRALCVWSWVHRGTRDQPGLVFGLDAGGSCVGRAYRVAAAERKTALEYLYARELVTDVYRPRLHPVHTPGGRCTALCFVVDRRHVQYAGRLEPAAIADVVGRARGRSGPNDEYVLNTLEHMHQLGIVEPELDRVRQLLAIRRD